MQRRFFTTAKLSLLIVVVIIINYHPFTTLDGGIFKDRGWRAWVIGNYIGGLVFAALFFGTLRRLVIVGIGLCPTNFNANVNAS